MKFSIIVPVYNVAPYLRECLDSVLAQTCADWECICVDDGSTDGSAAILDEYGDKDVRFRIVHKPNGGVASARNAALDVIQGEWFLFVDADDIVSPNLLSACAELSGRDEGVDVVKFQCQSFEHGTSAPQYSGFATASLWDCKSAAKLDYLRMGSCAFCMAYRRTSVGSLRQLSLTVGEDLHYMAQSLLRVRKMLACDAILYGHRARPRSAIHSPMTLVKARDGFRCAIEVYRLFENSGRIFSRSTRRWFGLAMFENAVWNGMQLKKSDKIAFFDEWHAGLAALESRQLFLPFDKMRYWINRMLPILAGAWCTGYLIEWLKRKGFHR